MTFCCIHCGYGIDALITRYGPSNYSLRQCQKCRNLADPYVDDAFPIKLVDLMLFKPRIFRHLLFNVEGQEDDKRLPTHKLPVVWRLGIATLLLEAYTRWSEEALFADTFSTLSDQQLWQGFLRGLLRQIGETVTLHCASYLVAYMFLRLRNRTQPKTPPFRLISLAYFYASLAKLFILFIVLIWRKEYITPSVLEGHPLLTISQIVSIRDLTISSLFLRLSSVENWRLWLIRYCIGGASALVGISVVLQESLAATVLVLGPAFLLHRITWLAIDGFLLPEMVPKVS